MIVIGGSLGGCEALRKILPRLPASYSLPIAVVLHRHRDGDATLADMLQQGCTLPVREVDDKEPIRPGRVYLCPADYHLLIDRDGFGLSTDEPVNYARPSVDVLFESAAEWGGPRVVAVILTGSGSDGSRGARRVRELGGTVIVQDPQTAESAWMPLAAVAATQTPFVLSLEEIASMLIALGALSASDERG